MTQSKTGMFDHIVVPNGLSLRLATSADVDGIKQLDDLGFGAEHGFSVEEIRALIEYGAVILLRTDSGQVIGETQVLLHSIPQLPYTVERNEAYYYGTAHDPDRRWIGRGIGSILAAAQDAFALKSGAKRASLTVRVENYPSLRLRFNSGFRGLRYILNFYGEGLTNARLFMTKSFEAQAQKEYRDVREVPVGFGDEPDPDAHAQASDLLSKDYVAIAAHCLDHDKRIGSIRFGK